MVVCWWSIGTNLTKQYIFPKLMSKTSKRKKSYSRREILEKLEECENDVKRAVDDIIADISPFDMSDINMDDFEVKLEALWDHFGDQKPTKNACVF